MNQSLTGKIAVVTGASSGIGRAIVEQFVAEGALVVAFARNREALQSLADAHAGSVAAASLAAKGDITVDTALISVAAALGSNLIVKTVLAFTAGGRRFGIGFLAAMAVPSLVFGAALTAAVVYG
ncbi:MAG TPA: SDR family NAD(P)-dependent oxidoreductase [Mycobacterium sp.]|nr:SDR family NAD(P)-dependent oxidoreductase [Mycobacterium sp.]